MLYEGDLNEGDMGGEISWRFIEPNPNRLDHSIHVDTAIPEV